MGNTTKPSLASQPQTAMANSYIFHLLFFITLLLANSKVISKASKESKRDLSITTNTDMDRELSDIDRSLNNINVDDSLDEELHPKRQIEEQSNVKEPELDLRD